LYICSVGYILEQIIAQKELQLDSPRIYLCPTNATVNGWEQIREWERFGEILAAERGSYESRRRGYGSRSHESKT